MAVMIAALWFRSSRRGWTILIVVVVLNALGWWNPASGSTAADMGEASASADVIARVGAPGADAVGGWPVVASGPGWFCEIRPVGATAGVEVGPRLPRAAPVAMDAGSGEDPTLAHGILPSHQDPMPAVVSDRVVRWIRVASAGWLVPVAVRPGPRVPGPETGSRVSALLARARQAIAAGCWTLPANSAAITYLGAILELDPQHDEAARELAGIWARFIDAGSYQRCRRVLPLAPIGVLEVVTVPPEANVHIASTGQQIGRLTPMTDQALPAGMQIVRLHLPGYGRLDCPIPIRDAMITRLVASLTIDPATVHRIVPVAGVQPDVDGTGFINAIGMRFRRIPAGTFRMGSPAGARDQRPVRTVTISRDFFLGSTEVTQAQYRAVMGVNPSHFLGEDRPVENVAWRDAAEFCRRLSAFEGNPYRLPTEAEWEYAARGANASDGWWKLADLSAIACFRGNSSIDGVPQTSVVAARRPGPSGVFDMMGNVWEWVDDWYARYPAADETDPTGPATGTLKLLRGGSWLSNATLCRPVNRLPGLVTDRNCHLGFRVCCPELRRTGPIPRAARPESPARTGDFGEVPGSR